MADDGNRTTFATSFWLDHESRELLSELVSELGMSRSQVVREGLRALKGDAQMTRVRRLIDELHREVSGK
jgi:Arc/MetJ-type ribon-helix-helix transcriptional regulator